MRIVRLKFHCYFESVWFLLVKQRQVGVVPTDTAPDLAFTDISLVITQEAPEADPGFGNPVCFLLKRFVVKALHSSRLCPTLL